MLKLFAKHPILFGSCLALSLALALLLPEDATTRFPGVRIFVAAMSFVVPAIRQSGMYSDFPQVANVVYSAVWLYAPWFYLAVRRSVFAFEGIVFTPESILHRRLQGAREYVHVFLGFLLFGFLAVFLYALDRGYDFVITFFNSSKLFLGTFALMRPLVCAGCAVFAELCARRLLNRMPS